MPNIRWNTKYLNLYNQSNSTSNEATKKIIPKDLKRTKECIGIEEKLGRAEKKRGGVKDLAHTYIEDEET